MNILAKVINNFQFIKIIMKTFILLMFNIMFLYSQNSEVEYLIYTSNVFSEHAERLSSIHENHSDLVTQTLFSEDIGPLYLSEYLFNIDNNYINNDDTFHNLKYFLIIGDESIISPLFYLGSTASDDYFSSKK